ncbi:uncharacterized protein [Macrobrachium rosenbergii]|uniref:uncharacterized protein isoform X1 n=1 Tax=Macrobrachium rosenbergii TaxID=79674 RepID=UPI0034D578B2
MNSANSREVLSDFIDLYQSFPCLWKIKSADYYNKHAKQIAQDKLVEKLKECDPNADRESCLRKINSLRASFRKEFKKVQASYKSGASTDDIYKPNLWYYEKLLFLKDQEMPGRSRSTIEEESFEREMVDCAEIEVRSSKSRPRTTKIRNEREELISLACKRLRGHSDDLDKLALAWASELRRMNPTQQIFAKKAINDVLIEGQLGTLHRHSVSINVGSAPAAQNAPTIVASSSQSPVEWKTDCQ